MKGLRDPKKYDPIAVAMVEEIGASGVLVLVVDGPLGTGAGLAMAPELATTPKMRAMARMLRLIADQVEEDAAALARMAGGT